MKALCFFKAAATENNSRNLHLSNDSKFEEKKT